MEGAGTVVRLLADDVEGGRHQRFILELASGQTVLVAHNIDVAPRLDGLEMGDEVAFRGVYEWNAQGGVVHWTHHDPSGEHAAGWLRQRRPHGAVNARGPCIARPRGRTMVAGGRSRSGPAATTRRVPRGVAPVETKGEP